MTILNFQISFTYLYETEYIDDKHSLVFEYFYVKILCVNIFILKVKRRFILYIDTYYA